MRPLPVTKARFRVRDAPVRIYGAEPVVADGTIIKVGSRVTVPIDQVGQVRMVAVGKEKATVEVTYAYEVAGEQE